MCGIAGIFSPQQKLDQSSLADTKKMCQLMVHRGPDEEGIYQNLPYAVLGHRRLSIIDVSDGQQPMSGSDRRYWITYNGEIYNYLELRLQLESLGHQFKTKSDTEVALVAYIQWGCSAAEKFEGMFSLAILDEKENSLWLARDHVGKKPLYYRWQNGIFEFCSELSPLNQIHKGEFSMDHQAMAFYLQLGYIPSPWSVYREIKKLQPGQWCLVDSRGIQKHRYWLPTHCKKQLDANSSSGLESLHGKLQSEVKRRLVSEVPLGAFLSGGIDSGLIVGMMSGMKPDLQTITVNFSGEDAQGSESRAAKLTAEYNKTLHREINVNPDFHKIMAQSAFHFGEPFADSSSLPTWEVSRAARENLTVAVSGDGGDEPFAGYDFRHLPHSRDAGIRKWIPQLLRNNLLKIMDTTNAISRGKTFFSRVHHLLQNLSVDEAQSYYRDLCFTPPEIIRKISPDLIKEHDEVQRYVMDIYNQSKSDNPLQSILMADVRFYLCENVLVKVDRMSMAHGLEVRSPLLAKGLIEMAFSIPAAQKVRKGQSKYILRKLSESYIPEKVRNLPKKGFHLPVESWLQKQWKEIFEQEVLLDGPGKLEWLDWNEVKSQWEGHQNGNSDRSHMMWSLWMLSHWKNIRKYQPDSVIG